MKQTRTRLFWNIPIWPAWKTRWPGTSGPVIEKKLVSRIKWEAEGFLKEIENSTVRKIALLQQNSQVAAAKNIQNGTAFLDNPSAPSSRTA